MADAVKETIEGEAYTFEPGGLARVAPETARRIRNAGQGDLVFLAVGGADGYVGRDGVQVED